MTAHLITLISNQARDDHDDQKENTIEIIASVEVVIAFWNEIARENKNTYRDMQFLVCRLHS